MNQNQIKAIFDQQAANYDAQWAKMAPIKNCLHLLLDSLFTELQWMVRRSSCDRRGREVRSTGNLAWLDAQMRQSKSEGMSGMGITLRVIGRVESPLISREMAPKQGEEGSPLAVLVFDQSVKEGLGDIKVGNRLLLLTWLDRAQRDVLQVHPRDNPEAALCGVFSTRSQDRPNPIGVHRVTVVSIVGPLRYQVKNLEAFNGTPILDVKATLDEFIE